MARSLLKAHERVKSLEWEHSYVRSPDRYPTEYKIPARTKDPFRHIMRDFFAMENDKDDRVYGSLQGVLARTDGTNKGDPRYVEILKALLPSLCDAEYFASQCMMQLSETVENVELRQGYLAQELDEIRHAQSEAWLARYYAKSYHDPAGFNVSRRCREWNPLLMAARSYTSTYVADDPIVGCLSLQVVGEAAYTNPVFVAMTEQAALSGDSVLPSLFLSIQSDEGRHMANGFSTLAAVLSVDDNLPLVQRDLDAMIWRNHKFFDVVVPVMFDYCRTPSQEARPYREYWDDWVWHDYGGGYLSKLEKFGLVVPDSLRLARRDIPWMGHTAAMLLYALWPLNFWRQAPVPESAFDWFEQHYPGWYSYFGPFWEDAVEWADPANGTLAMDALPEIPPLCRVCLNPCVFPRLDLAEVHTEEHGGRWHAFCSTVCRDVFHRHPARYNAHQNFGERFHGWNLADVVVEMGLLRPDGKTLIGQPHLQTERMWTIDDLRRIGFELRYPLAERKVTA